MNEKEKKEFKRIKKQSQETWLDDYDIKFLVDSIEKLQEENEELKFKEKSRIIGKYGYIEIHDLINRTLSNDYIPVQKVKDKVEELYQQDRNWSEEMSEPDSNFKNIDRNLKRIKNQIEVLLELLEGRK